MAIVLEFGGDSQERGELVEDLTAPLGTILAAMLATILLTFNSWRLTGIAFGVTGCSFGLSLLGAGRVPVSTLGVQALIGVIGSVGVSINAAIIILSGLKLNERASAGDPDAIVDVVMDASRHIVSTTVTTFGGFLPLILGGQSVLATLCDGDRRWRAAFDHCVVLSCAAPLHPVDASRTPTS